MSVWLEVLGYFLLFAALIYLLCHTADNYFSPVLAAICDLLDMPPEVAGVTFLAFGNGAPDVFSSLVALTSSSNREQALLVGMGSLLGAAIIILTVVVGSVVFIKPTTVPPAPFTRDVLFLVLALIMVLCTASVGSVNIWGSFTFLGVYCMYVVFVFKGPGSGTKNPSPGISSPSQDGLEFGNGTGSDYGTDGSVGYREDHAIDARWMPTNIDADELATGGTELGSSANPPPEQPKRPPHSNGRVENGTGGGSHGKDDHGQGDRNGGAARAEGIGDFSGRGHSVQDDYFAVGGKGREGGGEDWRLLGRRGGRGAAAERDVCSMVPGSTVSMFLEEDDSAAKWLAQRRWGGGIWGSPVMNNGTAGEVREDAGIDEPLLGGRGRSPIFGRGLLTANGGPGGESISSELSVTLRRFERAWASLQWKQWRLRRRLKRDMINSDLLQMPWYRRVLYVLELPFVLARNATIPPVEADSWSQLQAAVGTGMAPALVVWAFGLWGVGFLGISSSIFTWGFFSVLAGVPAGVAVWLTTHKGRMPSDRWYRLGLALVAFASCVAWIYWLAALAVEVIEIIGGLTLIPSSILGLTFLAWGNSCGDLVTNLAVARAGYPGMALAGSYGGPLFNLLLGVGLPMMWNAVILYPTPVKFVLDSTTLLTAWAALVVSVGTLAVVARAGYRFPEKAPLGLLGGYALYILVALIIVLA